MVEVPAKSIVDERLGRLLALVHDPLPEPQLSTAARELNGTECCSAA